MIQEYDLQWIDSHLADSNLGEVSMESQWPMYTANEPQEHDAYLYDSNTSNTVVSFRDVEMPTFSTLQSFEPESSQDAQGDHTACMQCGEISKMMKNMQWSMEMPPETLATAIDHLNIRKSDKSSFTKILITWLQHRGASDGYIEGFREKRKLMCVDRNQISKLKDQPKSDRSRVRFDAKDDVVRRLMNEGIDFDAPVKEIEERTREIKVGYHSDVLVKQAIQHYLKINKTPAQAALFRRLRKEYESSLVRQR